MVVLQSSGQVSCCLFWPAKDGRASQLQLGNIENSIFTMEPAQLISVLAVNHGHDRVERDAVALVADTPYRHQRSSNRSNLKDGLNVTPIIAQVQLALAQVGNGPAVAHEELLPSATAR